MLLLAVSLLLATDDTVGQAMLGLGVGVASVLATFALGRF
jgi:hypothetical protein